MPVHHIDFLRVEVDDQAREATIPSPYCLSVYMIREILATLRPVLSIVLVALLVGLLGGILLLGLRRRCTLLFWIVALLQDSCVRLRRLSTSVVLVRCLGLGFRLGCPCGWLHNRTPCHSEPRLIDIQRSLRLCREVLAFSRSLKEKRQYLDVSMRGHRQTIDQ